MIDAGRKAQAISDTGNSYIRVECSNSLVTATTNTYTNAVFLMRYKDSDTVALFVFDGLEYAEDWMRDNQFWQIVMRVDK